MLRSSPNVGQDIVLALLAQAVPVLFTFIYIVVQIWHLDFESLFLLAV